jgi:hypothetical protein
MVQEGQEIGFRLVREIGEDHSEATKYCYGDTIISILKK